MKNAAKKMTFTELVGLIVTLPESEKQQLMERIDEELKRRHETNERLN